MTPAARPDRARRVLGKRLRDLIAALSGSSHRAKLLAGATPVQALSQAWPEFNAALVWLELRTQLARRYPDVDAKGKLVDAARREVDDALAALGDDEFALAAGWLRTTVGEVPAAKSKAALVEGVRAHPDRHYPPDAASALARAVRAFRSRTLPAAQKAAATAARHTAAPAVTETAWERRRGGPGTGHTRAEGAPRCERRLVLPIVVNNVMLSSPQRIGAGCRPWATGPED